MNQVSDRPLTDQASGLIVSMTSHGARIPRVFASIESIGAGSLRPARLLLYLSNINRQHELPKSLLRLARRGLEIIFCDDVGPHTKYWPYVSSQQSFQFPLVTADDDKMYSPEWLEVLHERWLLFPNDINCFRARRIAFNSVQMLPYNTWSICNDTYASRRHFATGVGGVIYPPSFLRNLQDAGDDFLSLCPYADDVWLHAVAIRNGFKVRQVGNQAIEPAEVPFARRTALHKKNLGEGGNDQQIKKTYKEEDLLLLKSETPDDSGPAT